TVRAALRTALSAVGTSQLGLRPLLGAWSRRQGQVSSPPLAARSWPVRLQCGELAPDLRQGDVDPRGVLGEPIDARGQLLEHLVRPFGLGRLDVLIGGLDVPDRPGWSCEPALRIGEGWVDIMAVDRIATLGPHATGPNPLSHRLLREPVRPRRLRHPDPRHSCPPFKRAERHPLTIPVYRPLCALATPLYIPLRSRVETG